MSILDAIILGIVQGLTEFLPVSSSGHLKLAQYLLGLENLDKYIIFDIVCHLGTLVAILFIFSNTIIDLFRQNRHKFWQVVIGTLPLFPLVIIINPIKAAYKDPSFLGFFFLATSAILFLGCRFGKNSVPEKLEKNQWKDAFRIGLFQAIAILPGVSRSGSTISGARLLGWDIKDAITFSFLLAIPAILGAAAYEFSKLIQHPESALPLSFIHYLSGFLTSLLIGLFSLRLLKRLAVQNKFYYFTWYCLLLGIVTIFYYNIFK